MRKNILLFGHGYATQFIDISNQYTKLFDPKQFSVTVVYLVGEGSEEIRKKHLAENVIFLNSPKKSTRGLKLYAIKKMLQLHREKQFEIVVCHRYKPTYIMLWVAKLYKIPALFSVMHELGTMKSWARKTIIAALANQNTFFAGVSNAVRDDLRKSLWGIPQERIITLYNMIDVDLTEPQFFSREDAREKISDCHPERSEGSPTPGRSFVANNAPLDDRSIFIFGTIGRLAINKDQKTLIEAFSRAKPHCPHSKLLIIGDGQLESTLKHQVDTLGLTDDVIFTGFITDGFRMMKACDVYISSSIQEAFGRVLLEAMLAKIPVIATRVNGVPEVVGDAGILIDAANPEQMANMMVTLYKASNVEREQQGLMGYQRAIRDFSLQRFNQIFWGIIREKELA